MSAEHEVAVLGVGMHPWGKWGRNFVEYGIVAAAGRAGRRRPRLGRHRSSSPAPTPSATATRASSPAPRSPRRSAGRATGWPAATPPAPRAPRPSTSPGPRSWPGCATWPWWSAPTPRPRASSPRSAATAGTTRTGCASACSAPPTRPTSRSTPAAAWSSTAPPTTDFARGQGQERPARRWPTPTPATARRSPSTRCWPRRWSPTRCACSRSAPPPTAAPPSCSASMEFARRHGTTTRCGSRAISTVTPDLPQTRHRDAQLRHRLGRRGRPAPPGPSATPSPTPPTRRPASAPRTSTWPRSTTCRRPSSSTGTRTSGCARRARPSGCSATATPTIGGRIPVNPSGGLACFGEAIPAQAIAQVCELTWQLRGQADRPPGRGRPGRAHRQPGPVRPRLVGHRHPLRHRQATAKPPLRHPEERHPMPEAYIVDAVRTPVGRRGGGLSTVHPADLGAHVLRRDRRPQRPRSPRRRGRVLRLRRHHRPAGRRHRPHLLAGRRPARGGPGHHDRPPVRLVAAGACTSPPRRS